MQFNYSITTTNLIINTTSKYHILFCMNYLLLMNNLRLLHQYHHTNAISTNKLTNFNDQSTYNNYDI